MVDSRRKQAWQELGFCFSLAGLILIEEWAFLDWALEAVYPRYPLRVTDALFFLTAVCVIALPLWGLLRATLNRPKTRHWIFFAAALLLLLPLNFLRDHLNISVRFPVFSLTWVLAHLGKVGAAAVVVVFVGALGWVWSQYGARSRAALMAVVLCGLPFLASTFGRMAYTYVQHLRHPLTYAEGGPAVDKLSKPYRVVWVLFDEWDYALTYEKRAGKDDPIAPLNLPDLDALGKESFFATHAYSPMVHTHASIPAYLVGRQVVEFCRRPDNDIEVLFPPMVVRERLSRLPTVFSQLAQDGANVSVTGWYHPYCDFLPRRQLVACESVMYYEYGRPGEFLPRLASLGARVLNPMRSAPSQHQASYAELMGYGKRHANDPNIDLAYLHLSVPHLPGVFSRRRQVLVEDRKSLDVEMDRQHYVSNLALVNHAVKELVDGMKEAGVWDRTVLILTSDHSVHAWRWGLKDPDRRIPFIVRFPGAKGQTYNAPFNTVVAGELTHEILDGRVNASNIGARIANLSKVGPVQTGQPIDACPANEM